MADVLYLDTARLGQISPTAHRALTDYVRHYSEQGWPLYSQEIARCPSGESSALCDSLGIRQWCGIEALKQKVRHLFDAQTSSEIWFAARSAELMKISAKLLFGRCQNVMLTDLTWPGYETILCREASACSAKFTKIKILDRIFDGLPASQIIELLQKEFITNRCDGLFMPLVSNLGIHFPIRELVEQLRSITRLRFAVMDAAQAYNHVPIETQTGYFDFAFGGGHKWLRSFLPIGIGISGRRDTADYIQSSISRWIGTAAIDDPLLALLSSNEYSEFGETVNLSPLVSLAGALSDALDETKSKPEAKRVSHSLSPSKLGEAIGCKLHSTHESFRSRISIFSPIEHSCKTSSQVFAWLRGKGIHVSLIHDRLLRVSFPAGGLRKTSLNTFLGRPLRSQLS